MVRMEYAQVREGHRKFWGTLYQQFDAGGTKSHPRFLGGLKFRTPLMTGIERAEPVADPPD